VKLGSFIQGRVSAYRDTPDLEGHRKRLREALGNTLSDEFVERRCAAHLAPSSGPSATASASAARTGGACNRHRGKGASRRTRSNTSMCMPAGRRWSASSRARIAHTPQPAVWSADKKLEPVPVSGDAERPLPNARRDVPGRPEG
jgi:hypothetical protein